MAKRLLIKGGAVVSVDPAIGELRVGDVLVEDDRIVEVAESIDAGDAEVIDASGMVVMPGLIDSHRHFWQTGTRADTIDGVFWDLVASQWPKVAARYTAEDVYANVLAGAAHALDNGITTVLDWCHIVNTPEHAEEDVRALREIGIRSVFLYGASMARKLNEFEGDVETTDSWGHARLMRERDFPTDDGLVTFGLAIQGAEVTTMEITDADVKTARELGVPMSMHCGAPQGPAPLLSIKRISEAGILGADMNFVHCCTTTDEEFRLLAGAGGTAIACPSIDMALGMGIPSTGRMRDAGLRPTVGTDSVIGSTGDMFDEARAGLWAERSRHAQALFAGGVDAKKSEELRFTTREALESVTINGAHAIWMGDRIGSLTPGKKADIILLRATDLNLAPLSDIVGTLVCCASARNVDTVIVDGKVVKRDGALLGIDVDRVRNLLVEARDRMYSYDDYDGMRPPAAVAGARAG